MFISFGQLTLLLGIHPLWEKLYIERFSCSFTFSRNKEINFSFQEDVVHVPFPYYSR